MADLMTIAPQTIGAEVSIAAARRMMADFGVRHLPVRADGRLVGVVSESDLDHTHKAAHRPVVEVMNPKPLVVTPFADAADVASAMAEGKSDAAIVVDNERVIGIFTSTDAARALATTLHVLAERR